MLAMTVPCPGRAEHSTTLLSAPWPLGAAGCMAPQEGRHGAGVLHSHMCVHSTASAEATTCSDTVGDSRSAACNAKGGGGRVRGHRSAERLVRMRQDSARGVR